MVITKKNKIQKTKQSYESQRIKVNTNGHVYLAQCVLRICRDVASWMVEILEIFIKQGK